MERQSHRPRRAATLPALTCALVLGLVPRLAAAGEAESKTFFAEGRALRTSGRCADAIPVFRRALETYPDGLGALRNIAECEEELGRIASARRSWWDLRLAAAQSSAARYEGWSAEAERRHAELASRVAKITVLVRPGVEPGVVVQLDGAPLDPALLGVEIEQDEGEHRLSISARGAPAVDRTIQVLPAARLVVELLVPAGPAEPAPTRPPPPEARGSDPGLRLGGFLALGVGALGLVGTGVSIGLRQEALGAVDGACPSRSGCPSSVEPDVERGEVASALVNVFAATALVGAGVGVTLLVLSGDDEPEAGTTSRAAVGLTASPSGALIGLGGAL